MSDSGGVFVGWKALQVMPDFRSGAAEVAMVQLRTRHVRLPVPTQRQLDSARKILSSYEDRAMPISFYRMSLMWVRTENWTRKPL